MKRVLGILFVLISLGWTESRAAEPFQFQGIVGLQMYSLRDICGKDLEAGIRTAADMGFQYVEAARIANVMPENYGELLKKYGLTCVVAPAEFPELKTDEGIQKLIGDAKMLGARYVHVCWIPHEAPFDEADAKAAAEVFNRAGEQFAKAGLGLVYHNHGYEFLPGENGTPMEILIQATDPKYVHFEMDVLWVFYPGADAVQLLEKYPTRWALMHLKDLKKGVTGNHSGGTDVRNDVPLGTGQVNLSAILEAAQKAGVKYYFIEDESPSSTTQIPQSVKYLDSLR